MYIECARLSGAAQGAVLSVAAEGPSDEAVWRASAEGVVLANATTHQTAVWSRMSDGERELMRAARAKEESLWIEQKVYIAVAERRLPKGTRSSPRSGSRPGSSRATGRRRPSRG